ncbi:MAG TPA: hypothetical protein PKY31_06620 [Spirochaetota bacterium]|nr:hypothetical protein [Spirochaetota bacterium]
MRRAGVFIAAAVFFFAAACASVGVAPQVTLGNRLIDDDAVRPKLGKLDLRGGMMDAQAFAKAMDIQRKAISGDKGLTEEQKAKNLHKLNEQSFAAGQWWWAQFIYEKNPGKGAFAVSMFDANGDTLSDWSIGRTTRYSNKMTVGKDVIETITYEQSVILKTKVPLTRQNIALDRSPVIYRISAFNDNRLVYFIIPR